MSSRTLIFAVIVSAACSSPDERSDAGNDAGQAVSDMTSDAGGQIDARFDDVATGGDTSSQDARVSDTLPPDEYCESIVGFFCDYYLRCDRTVTESVEDCETVFLETCNTVFEPQYAALADQGKLRLSATGVEQCRGHLADVQCSEQLFDLDGGCANVWEGQSPSADPCAPGIGSFVCREGTNCVIDLDFCGTCKDAVSIGEDCSDADTTCEANARCVDGTCVERGLPGATCSDTSPCVVGASCEQGTCVGFTVVTEGDACDQARRCPYTSSCVGGVCVRDALVGEDCSVAVCASGRCDGTVCRPFVAVGEACTEGTQCVSGICDAGTCAPPVSMCFQ